MEDLQTEATQTAAEEGSPEDNDDEQFTGIAQAKTKMPEHQNADEEGVVRVSVPFDAGETLDEAVEKWGEELVLEYFQSLFKRKLQNKMRRELKDGVSVEIIEEDYSPDSYDPTTSSRGRSTDPLKEIQKNLNKLDDEQKAELREQFDL